MRHEPTELNLMKPISRANAIVRRAVRHGRPVLTAGVLPTADVLDAAFEDYTSLEVPASARDTRRDAAPNDIGSFTKSLSADIAAQLDLLDRQREQLAALLRDVDARKING